MVTSTTAEPTVGELRFIARLSGTKLPLEYPFGSVSTTAGSSSAIEGSGNGTCLTSSVPLPLYCSEVSCTDNLSSTANITTLDVYLVNGQSRSKFCSSERFIDDYTHCVYRDDDAIHACILLNSHSYEGSSGGPFF